MEQTFEKRVVKLMSEENVTRATTTESMQPHRVFSFLIPLNKRAHNHHSADYRGSNYLDLKMVSTSNKGTQIFLSKSHYK